MDDATYTTLTYHESGRCRFVDLGTRFSAIAREGLSAETEDAAAAAFVELAAVCERIAWDEQAGVVVLSFDGKMGDVDHYRDNAGDSPVAPVAKLKQPVIAVMRGDAIGIGLELALACDIRIASDDAYFGCNQIRGGRIPSNGGTQRLPRLIGQSKAMEMILTGETVSAEEARRMGLVHRIVSSSELVSSATEMADAMSSKSPLSLSYAKEALYSGGDLTLDQGLKMELDLYLLLFSTADRTEGITAFKEKRKPRFEGA